MGQTVAAEPGGEAESLFGPMVPLACEEYEAREIGGADYAEAVLDEQEGYRVVGGGRNATGEAGEEDIGREPFRWRYSL